MSNLGFHIDASREFSGQFDLIADAKPVALTAIFNKNEPAKSAGAINACRFAVVRWMDMEAAISGSDKPGALPAANMQRAFDMLRPFLGAYPNAYWMYPRNEIGDWSLSDLYNAEMIEWINLCVAAGVKAAVGGFSFGTPDYPYWPQFAGMLRRAVETGNLLNLHEYGVMDMRVSGFDAIKNERHHCLRYRTVWKRFPSLPRPQIFIGETGLDVDVNTGQGGPWRAVGTTPEQYLDQLIWYDTEISKDGVIATVFKWSAVDDDFNIGRRRGDQKHVAFELLGRIKATTPNLKPIPPVVTLPPVPAPEPAPAPGDYETTAVINIRTGPGMIYAIAGTIRATVHVPIEAIANIPDNDGIIWAKVRGLPWYLAAKYLKKIS